VQCGASLLQDEMKEQEGQQLLENMEKMQMEEIKVHALHQYESKVPNSHPNSLFV